MYASETLTAVTWDPANSVSLPLRHGSGRFVGSLHGSRIHESLSTTPYMGIYTLFGSEHTNRAADERDIASLPTTRVQVGETSKCDDKNVQYVCRALRKAKHTRLCHACMDSMLAVWTSGFAQMHHVQCASMPYLPKDTSERLCMREFSHLTILVTTIETM
jgi:hypothetical protein